MYKANIKYKKYTQNKQYNNNITIGTFGRHGPCYFLISCRDRYWYNNEINVGTFGRHMDAIIF
jgi:hypothetical protein